MSRSKTKEEVCQEFVSHVLQIADYWANEPRAETARAKCRGTAFSILVMFDGGSAGWPAMDILLAPHPSDKEYHQGQGEDWYEPGMAFNDEFSLHDLFSQLREEE